LLKDLKPNHRAHPSYDLDGDGVVSITDYKLAKDMDLHRNENQRLMREGVSLTQEINDLRRELHIDKALRAPNSNNNNNPGPGSDSRNNTRMTNSRTPQPPGSRGAGSREAWTAGSGGSGRGSRLTTMDAQRELEMQQQQLVRLRTHIAANNTLPACPVTICV
jgi:hypothetical protein